MAFEEYSGNFHGRSERKRRGKLARFFSFLWRKDTHESRYDSWNGMNRPNSKRIIIALAVTAVFAFLTIYFTLPAWTIHNPGLFWIFAAIIAVFAVISGYYGRGVIIILGLILFLLIGGIFSGQLFNAAAYSRILSVNEGSIEDIPSVEDTSRIALMDTDSAKRLGDREIGVLTDIVSQFDVSGFYTQINTHGRPMKVAPLVYSDFFKWLHNRYAGAPGYVEVDPVGNTSDYVELERGMIYVPSACFGQNLTRHLRGLYPSMMFDSSHFEIDEEGAPFYITPVYEHTVGLFGGKQISGVIITDPCTGRADWYRVGNIPEWVDMVYDGDLICRQYNWSAQLALGWWNAHFGQRDCRKVTTGEGVDYGFLAIGDDIWIYTGITSVNGDSSNIGFLLSNQRTEETKFVTQPGANEFSAMAAAEGEGGVVEKRYVASFPSLVRFGDEMAYLMVLKDAAGLVKMYAAVDVEQYNLVAATTVQNDTVARFRQMLAGEPVTAVSDGAGDGSGYSGSGYAGGPGYGYGYAGYGYAADTPQALAREVFFAEDSEHTTITVVMVGYDLVVVGGETYAYIGTDDGDVYFSKYTDVTSLVTLHVSAGVNSRRVAIETDGTYFIFPA